MVFGVLALLALGGCQERATGPDDVSTTTATTVLPRVEVRVLSTDHRWLRQRSYGWLSSWRAVLSSTGRVHCSVGIRYYDDHGFLVHMGEEPANLEAGLNNVNGQEFIPEDTALQVVDVRARVGFCR